MIDPELKKDLEAKGFKFGDYADFLELTPEEKSNVERMVRDRFYVCKHCKQRVEVYTNQKAKPHLNKMNLDCSGHGTTTTLVFPSQQEDQ